MKPDLTAEVPAAEDLGRVHFIGIGGAGMSGIARILLARGLPVSGSDAKDSRGLAELRALGAVVHLGHDEAQLGDARTVVVSSAVRETNPELALARRRGLRILHRSQALAAVMRGRRAVAVAGTHGKTTTTSMLTVALQGCGADPSFAIGGELTEGGANAHHGTGDVFVAEADESDGSFLLYRPAVAVVTNVEPDHLDHYGTAEAVEAAFDAFAGGVAPGGAVVLCADDPGAARVAGRVRGREGGPAVLTYGESADADVRVADIVTGPAGVGFRLIGPGDPADGGRRLQLRVPGRHNALNAAAAWTAATWLGFAGELVAAGLESFGGTRRRFEAKGTAAGVRVFDDYAHHPTEVAAVLRAARGVAGEGRVLAVFQPHLYSRTRIFARDFGQALGLADEVVVMDVYAAREDPEPGVSGALIASAVPLPAERVGFQPSWSAVAADVAARTRPGDLVLTVGAGDVTMLGPEILAVLASGDLAATIGEADGTPGSGG
ncbi:MAG TPA: UDP-N-acetylmuramate--L-alanine ligase [Kineosporiaceae bacterium]|nr:UDP-N-acetylmuramate--L-alanine ligase [Kineosporiaceae bacterium]